MHLILAILIAGGSAFVGLLVGFAIGMAVYGPARSEYPPYNFVKETKKTENNGEKP